VASLVNRQAKIKNIIKVGIDCRCLTGSESGIPTYLYQILRNFKKDPGLQFFLFSPCKFVDNFLDLQDVYTVITPPFEINNNILKQAWIEFFLPYYLYKNQINVFWGPNHRIPFFAPKSIHKIITIHDLTYKLYRGTMKRTTRFLDSISIPYGLRKADRVVTVSHSTKLDILKNFKNVSAIDVVYPASKFKLGLHGDTLNEKSEKFPIGKGYILFVGSFEPRKNIARLLEAYSMLDSGLRKNHQLVCAGFNGWKFNIDLAVERLNLTDSVRIIRSPSDKELEALYRNALFLAMPSLYEGFGLPIVEAMNFGLPVLTSNNSSMYELCQDCGVLVSPFSVDSIHTGMLSLICDENLRGELSKCSVVASKIYTWKNSAEKYKNFFSVYY